MTLARFVRPTVSVSLEEPVARAARLLADARVGCVIATRDGRPIGILTDRDLALRVVAERRDPVRTRVADVVTYDPITLREDDEVETAVLRMREHGVRRLPIVGDDGRIKGIVTADDLLTLFGKQLSAMCDGLDEAADASDSR